MKRRGLISSSLFAIILLAQAGLASAGGTARYSQTINYSGNLYYYVTGGPPNTCGELDTYRNGSWLFAPGWLCTDANGNATKGPWSWSNTPSDQTDEPTFIRWPDGTTTNSATHIWDKTCPQTYRDTPLQKPPTAYSGHATDGMWGAGFDFPLQAFSTFADVTNPLDQEYWVNSTYGYSSVSGAYIPASLTHVNRWYVNWSTAFPPASQHIPGHTYSWVTCVTDGSTCASGCSSILFTVPY
jgi:hypothetical protein